MLTPQLEKDYLSPHFMLLVALCLPVMIACMDVMAVSVALNNIMTELHTSVIKVQWLLSGYTIGTAAFLIVIGKLADLYGRRKVLAYGVLLFGMASLIAALAHAILPLIIARFLQGIASAIMMTAVISIITHEFPPQERGTVITQWGVALGVGLAIGPLVGGVLVHFFNWQMIFIINIPIALLSYFLIIRFIPESKNATDSAINWLQALSLTVFLVALVTMLSEGGVLGWQSHFIKLTLVVQLISLAIYGICSRYMRHVLIDFSLFRYTNFSAATLCGFISYFCMYAWLFIMSLYLQNVDLMSPVTAGLVCSAYSIAFAFSSKLLTRIIAKTDPKSIMKIGFILIAIAFLWMTTINTDTAIGQFVLMFALLGAAITLVNAPSMTLATLYVPVKQAGIASGLVFTIRWLGGTLGVVLITLIYHQVSSITLKNLAAKLPLSVTLSQQAATRGLFAACLLLVGVAVVGVLSATFFIQSQKE